MRLGWPRQGSSTPPGLRADGRTHPAAWWGLSSYSTSVSPATARVISSARWSSTICWLSLPTAPSSSIARSYSAMPSPRSLPRALSRRRSSRMKQPTLRRRAAEAHIQPMSRILLIVGGGIAAYKAAKLIRLLRKEGHEVTPVLTEGGSHFVTPMSLAALAESPVYTSLWDLKDEAEMGHIQLSRAADVVLVAPATADLIARMAAGEANDLATTLLLATDKPVIVAPAMNVRMWQHAATKRNIEQLKADGITVLEPDEGPMACGEYGPGRLPEPTDIYQRIKPMLGRGVSVDVAGPEPLAGKHILITAGPTHEPID